MSRFGIGVFAALIGGLAAPQCWAQANVNQKGTITSEEGPATIKKLERNARNKPGEVEAALQILLDFLNMQNIRIANVGGKDVLRMDPASPEAKKALAQALNEAAPGGL